MQKTRFHTNPCIGLLVLLFLPGFAQVDDGYRLYLTQIATAEALLQLNKISEAHMYLEETAGQYRGLEYNFLKANLDQSTQKLETQNVSYSSIAMSPNGRIVAAACSDSTIHLFQYPEMHLLRTLRGHQAAVSTIAFSMSGEVLASGGRDHAVILWNVASGSIIAQNSQSFRQGIYQVRFSPDDLTLGVVSWEPNPETKVMGFLKILDARNALELNKIETDPHPAAGIVFPDPSMAIVSTWGEIVYALNTTTRETLWTYDLSNPEEYNAFHSIALSPDRKTVAVGSADHRIYIFNTSSGALLRRIEPWEGHSRTLKALAYSHDGKYLSSAGEDETILVWSTEDYRKIQSLIAHTGTVTGLEWSADDQTLLSTSLDGTLRQWDMQQPFMIAYTICDFGPWQTPLTRDGRYFAAPCSDKNLVIYSCATGQPLVNFGPISGLCADISNDGTRLVTSSFDGIVHLWDVQSGNEIRTYSADNKRVDGVVYLDQNEQIVSSSDTLLYVWDPKHDDPTHAIPLHSSAFRMAELPDGSAVISGCSDGTLVIYDPMSWKEITRIKCEADDLDEMAVSPDSKWIAVFTGRVIEIWSTATWSRAMTLAGHLQGGYGLGFSPDSRYLVSGSYDQTFRLWNLERQTCTLTYHGYEEVIYSCKFPDDNSLLIGTSQGLMRYYRFRNKNENKN